MATMICAACRRVLAIRTDETGVSLVHTLQDAHDHAPEPIPMPDGYREGRCDFCNRDDQSYLIPARDFGMDDRQMSSGEWAACDPCMRLIERNRWNDLLTRVLAVREQLGQETPPELRPALARMYRVLRKNISGSARPI